MRTPIIIAAALLAAALPAAPSLAEDVPLSGDIPAGFWSARLWLTSQAFGLREDCPLRVLFRDPPFRPVGTAEGAAVTPRLVSCQIRGGDLFVVIETTGGRAPVEQVTLQLRWHRPQGIVSVEGIDLAGASGAQTLLYQTAIDDDEEYDLYTDTLVSLYRALFDEGAIRRRVEADGG